MHYCQVGDGSCKAILIFDPVDVKEACGHIGSQYQKFQWHVRSYGWHHASYAWEQDSREWRLVLCQEVSTTESVHMLCWSHSNDGYASHFCTYPRSFPEGVILYEVGQGNGYQSWGRDMLYYTIPGNLSEVCGEWRLCQTLTSAVEQSWMCNNQQSRPLHKGFKTRWIIPWSIWLVQQWERILETWQCG